MFLRSSRGGITDAWIALLVYRNATGAMAFVGILLIGRKLEREEIEAWGRLGSEEGMGMMAVKNGGKGDGDLKARGCVSG